MPLGLAERNRRGAWICVKAFANLGVGQLLLAQLVLGLLTGGDDSVETVAPGHVVVGVQDDQVVDGPAHERVRAASSRSPWCSAGQSCTSTVPTFRPLDQAGERLGSVLESVRYGRLGPLAAPASQAIVGGRCSSKASK